MNQDFIYRACQVQQTANADSLPPVFQNLCSMKNFYANRRFNFIKLFSNQGLDQSELGFKYRFNFDVFNHREFTRSKSY